jgi:hypothetical protein
MTKNDLNLDYSQNNHFIYYKAALINGIHGTPFSIYLYFFN